MPDAQELIRTTCPRDCFDTCGIAVLKRDGVIAHVRGDPHHPVSRGKLCPKCSIDYNREWRDPHARLTRPLRRVGPKGEGRFEPVSWDAALAFALLHVLWRDGLIDEDFVHAHTVGWEELAPLLPGCTPAWGEATTGVPAWRIEEAAHLYGRGPLLLWLGLGLQRQPTGGNVIRACALLPAVTGNLGKPGAGFLYLGAAPGQPGGGFSGARRHRLRASLPGTAPPVR